MIQFAKSDSGSSPIMICDICNKRIDNGHLGAAIHSQSQKHENGNHKVIHVHKGECMDLAEKQEGVPIAWQEMSQHLRLLLVNVHLDLMELEKEGKIDKQFGLTNE